MTMDANTDEQWIQHCFDLAVRGLGYVSPNPPVGAVLVHDNQIIGEGFHSGYGNAHAEVEAFNSVKPEHRHLIPASTLYVSLEPCCIQNKTPPCSDRIIAEGIKDLRISIPDPNPSVAGKGIEILKLHGVKVTSGILQEKGEELIRTFRTNILFQRPHVILKWAQSRYGYIGETEKRIHISDPLTNIWSHQLRSIVDAIMVGARTVRIDHPRLTARDSSGRSPHRVIYDPSGTLSLEYAVFMTDECKVFYFSLIDNPKIEGANIFKFTLQNDRSHAQQILAQLFAHKIGSLLVEGGSYVLDQFIQDDLWDETWVIRSAHSLNSGVKAPVVDGKLIRSFEIATDTIVGIENQK